MQIDSATVLLSGILIKALLGFLFLIFWLYDRRSIWFAWWSATFLFGVLASSVFLRRGVETGQWGISVGVAILIFSFGLCWHGARSFDGRRPLWFPVVGAVCIWAAACLIPGFLEDAYYRAPVASLLLSGLSALSGFEFWRGRGERLPSRWPVIILFATLSLFFICRILFINVLPFPFGALPAHPAMVGIFNLVLFFHTLILTVLFVAMSKERLELAQRRNAQTDPLTGALNRRALMSRGQKMATRHEYEEAPLCLLILDLDHFKSLNDRFGHSAGDDVLTHLVKVAQDSIRPSDFLFRLGGEEFCCLLPNTVIGQGQAVAERIRRQVESATMNVGGTVVRITVSLGLASTETFGYDLDTLMRKADNAVYAAKRQGRNRVAIAEAEEFVASGKVVAALSGRAASVTLKAGQPQR